MSQWSHLFCDHLQGLASLPLTSDLGMFAEGCWRLLAGQGLGGCGWVTKAKLKYLLFYWFIVSVQEL